ncbi:MAG: hypothetical protein NC938_00980 [Candidatus Omnitrophica bacterium]|nr:hypothetical protein [Candidatus Omnitrophota bacterium]MCM8790262.1 hypothetical protein [Candidatus Omnitrophota bacterium]
MRKRIIAYLCIAIIIGVTISNNVYAEGKTGGQSAKSFWQKLFNYPANVTKESVNVVADTGKKGTEVVTNQVKTLGEVTSGDVKKAQNLVTDPIIGTGETAKIAAEGTVNAPVKAAKE